MLKKLRIRFVCVLMALVTGTLCAIFAFLYHNTRINLQSQSIAAMESIVKNPIQSGQLGGSSD